MQALSKRLTRPVHEAHNTNFPDKRRAHVVRFNLLGINILSRAKDDDLLLAAGNEKIATLILVAEIAAQEPAIADRVSRGVRTIVIALHHDLAADGNLTHRVRHALRRLRVDDLHLNALERLADRAHHIRLRRRDRSPACDLGEPVRLQNPEAELLQVPSHAGIERRAAGNEEAHLRPEPAMNGTEEQLA